MPTDLEVVEADEAAGNDRPVVPRGRMLVFALLALVFVVMAVMSSFRRERTESSDWVEHLPGVALYRMDQPHLKSVMYEIPQSYTDVHNDLCHKLKFPTTGGAIFRARSIFLGMGRSHYAKIPGTVTATNEYTLFAVRDGLESNLALVKGNPKRKPTHLLLVQHRVESKHPHHTFPLATDTDHIYPPALRSFARGAWLSGATVTTGDPYTNIVNFYRTKFKPVSLGTAKATAFVLPPADPSRKDSFTMFLQSSRGPKLIHVVDVAGTGQLSIVDFRR